MYIPNTVPSSSSTSTGPNPLSMNSNTDDPLPLVPPSPNLSTSSSSSSSSSSTLISLCEANTFTLLVRILQGTRYKLQNLYKNGLPDIQIISYILQYLLENYLPHIHQHFQEVGIDMIFIFEWYFTLFTLILPPDLCIEVWDDILTTGWISILSICIALLAYLDEQNLLLQRDFHHTVLSLKAYSNARIAENFTEIYQPNTVDVASTSTQASTTTTTTADITMDNLINNPSTFFSSLYTNVVNIANENIITAITNATSTSLPTVSVNEPKYRILENDTVLLDAPMDLINRSQRYRISEAKLMELRMIAEAQFNISTLLSSPGTENGDQEDENFSIVDDDDNEYSTSTTYRPNEDPQGSGV